MTHFKGTMVQTSGFSRYDMPLYEVQRSTKTCWAAAPLVSFFFLSTTSGSCYTYIEELQGVAAEAGHMVSGLQEHKRKSKKTKIEIETNLKAAEITQEFLSLRPRLRPQSVLQSIFSLSVHSRTRPSHIMYCLRCAYVACNSSHLLSTLFFQPRQRPRVGSTVRSTDK